MNNTNIPEELKNLSNYEKLDAFKALLIGRATGESCDDNEYKYLRKEILNISGIESLLPEWVKRNRDSNQFWGFIQPMISSYKERRHYIYNELSSALDYVESNSVSPIVNLEFVFDEVHINDRWKKALERITINDYDGAITIARTLIEDVLKSILENENITYNNDDLSVLYKKVAKLLKLAPEDHYEKIFKQILHGVNGIVNGLGSLRNKAGDAHGNGPTRAKPKERHAELAVNMAGSAAIFVYKTYKQK